MADFYSDWLGIAPGPRPPIPSHYQLLGIDPSEQLPDVIRGAAESQLRRIQIHFSGPYAADCLRIADEIIRARDTVLDAVARKLYDSTRSKAGEPWWQPEVAPPPPANTNPVATWWKDQVAEPSSPVPPPPIAAPPAEKPSENRSPAPAAQSVPEWLQDSIPAASSPPPKSEIPSPSPVKARIARKASNEAPLETELDLLREKRCLGDDHGDIYDRALDFLHKLGLPERALRPRDSLAILDDAELERVRKTIERYRLIREAARVKLPALRFAIAKLEMAAGEYLAAWKGFSSVAAVVASSADKAVAHFNVFRAAMERRNWDSALSALLDAAKADPRFELIPLARFRPKRVLGGGACGVSILCKDKNMDETVVVKAYWHDDQLRDMDKVFDENRALAAIDHPNILRFMDCGYVDAVNSSRPYAVMEYFEGKSLETLVREEGTLASKDVVTIATRVASAVQAAHVRNILHRSIKPGNVFVQRKDDDWQIRVVDFGAELCEPDIEIAPVSMRSLVAISLADTADSVAPEQLGKIKGASVGPSCDVYGLAKTCLFALFQTPRPNRSQFDFLPRIIIDVLEHCLEKDPDNRPSMKTVIKNLQRLSNELQVSTRYVPARGLRWSDKRNEESPVERRNRLRRESE